MSLETLQFGLPDPLQANVTVKAYDCLALFLDITLLDENNMVNDAKRASAIQTLTEFYKLVKYYHDNGTLTTFYIANINDASTRSAMESVTYGAASSNGWVLMWIRGGGKLENNAMHVSGGVSASILDDMLRYNPRHDPAIDSVLAYSGLLGPDVPVATSDTYKLFTKSSTSANTVTAPTAFTTTSVTAESNSARMPTNTPDSHQNENTVQMTDIHWMFIGLGLITAYILFVNKNK